MATGLQAHSAVYSQTSARKFGREAARRTSLGADKCSPSLCWAPAPGPQAEDGGGSGEEHGAPPPPTPPPRRALPAVLCWEQARHFSALGSKEDNSREPVLPRLQAHFSVGGAGTEPPQDPLV
uniref:Uncharacterized protein n=1 Tax=Rangifer tarandus platyrhynchus TaxID=3082113 RepID=A0ACB0EIJ5_RANTA|nr:unnamed protein product [Rangifer tarandus platyrhynchus]